MNPQSPYGSPTPQYTPPGAPQQMPGYGPQPSMPQPTPYLRPKQSKTWLVIGIVFIATTLIFVGLFVWALINYIDQRDNVDSKVDEAVASAVKEQADKDAADFLEKEKEPNRQFSGPEDYGTLEFEYPKTWSMYVANDASSGGNYEAYFNPVSVTNISESTQYALRVTIQDTDYDSVINSYQSKVESGKLQSSGVKVNDVSGTRLDGEFSTNIIGSAVIFKIRDKTAILRTDAKTFESDFNALVDTITYIK